VEYYTFASVDGQPRPNYSKKAIALKDARNRDSERNGLLTSVSLSEFRSWSKTSMRLQCDPVHETG